MTCAGKPDCWTCGRAWPRHERDSVQTRISAGVAGREKSVLSRMNSPRSSRTVERRRFCRRPEICLCRGHRAASTPFEALAVFAIRGVGMSQPRRCASACRDTVFRPRWCAKIGGPLMDGERFDSLAKSLMAMRTRRLTLKAAAGGALAFALGREEAAAACKATGKKCDKPQQCCSKRCKKGKCKCTRLQVACKDHDQCCNASCFPNHCSAAKKCCRVNGKSCQKNCDCCGEGRCLGGKCCLPQGATCAFGGICCTGLFCDPSAGITCQPAP